MTNKEAVKRLMEFCRLKPFCELYPDECRENECEIYLAIEALENLPSAQPEENLKPCKNCIHLGHAYMMPCKNCRRNQMMPDWYEEVCNNG